MLAATLSSCEVSATEKLAGGRGQNRAPRRAYRSSERRWVPKGGPAASTRGSADARASRSQGHKRKGPRTTPSGGVGRPAIFAKGWAAAPGVLAPPARGALAISTMETSPSKVDHVRLRNHANSGLGRGGMSGAFERRCRGCLLPPLPFPRLDPRTLSSFQTNLSPPTPFSFQTNKWSDGLRFRPSPRGGAHVPHDLSPISVRMAGIANSSHSCSAPPAPWAKETVLSVSADRVTSGSIAFSTTPSSSSIRTRFAAALVPSGSTMPASCSNSVSDWCIRIGATASRPGAVRGPPDFIRIGSGMSVVVPTASPLRAAARIEHPHVTLHKNATGDCVTALRDSAPHFL